MQKKNLNKLFYCLIWNKPTILLYLLLQIKWPRFNVLKILTNINYINILIYKMLINMLIYK